MTNASKNKTAALTFLRYMLGYGSQAVVTGDVTQVDLLETQKSGMNVAREVLKGVDGISFVDFDERDVVRHELVARIVRAYDRHERKPE